MRIPFTHIHFKLTTAEKVAAAAAAVGSWTAFSAVFSTAPLWATLIAIPSCAAVSVGVVKVAKAGLRMASDYIQDYASEHPGGKVDRWFAGEYQPDADLSDDEDVDESLEPNELQGLHKDLAKTKVKTIAPGFVNFGKYLCCGRGDTHTIEAADGADYNKPPGTNRSGLNYRA